MWFFLKSFSVILIFMTMVVAGCSSNSSNSTVSTESDGSDDYPSKEIEWIIPFSPGSGADTFARTLIKATEKHLGAKIVPVNQEGGGSSVGVAYALNKPADGYTVFSHSTTLPFMIAADLVQADVDNIIGINQINADYKVLAVLSDSPIETFDDFVTYAKENPIRIGGVGRDSWSEVFKMKVTEGADIEADYIPYNGGSEVVSSLLGGNNVEAVVVTSSNVTEHVKSGDIRLLAVSLSERSESYPDVPTFKELGYDNIDNDLLWRGVFGKKGIPEERLKILSEAFQKAIEETEWLDYMENKGQLEAFEESAEFTEIFEDSIQEGKDFFSR